MILYISFKDMVAFKIMYLLYPVLYYFFLSILTMTMKNIGKNHDIFIFGCSIIFGILGLVYCNYLVLLALIVGLLLLNIYFFHFTRISE